MALGDTAEKEDKLKQIAEKKKQLGEKVQKVPIPKRGKHINNEFQKGNTFLVIVDGRERYLTKGTIEVALQQSQSKQNGYDIVIPKGSPYTPPAYYKDLENCIGCGKR